MVESVPLAAPLCGPGRRLVAWGIDWVLIGVVAGVLIAVGGPERNLDGAVVPIAFVYEWFFLAWYAATPGKMLMGIQVRGRADGARPGTGRAAGRAAALLVMMSFCGVFDVIPIFWGERQCLHDMIAGTVVVRTP